MPVLLFCSGYSFHPPCARCKHFIPCDKIYPFFNEDNGLCNRFYRFNSITGNKIYDKVFTIRKRPNMCGENGTFFEEKV